MSPSDIMAKQNFREVCITVEKLLGVTAIETQWQ